MRPGYRPPVMPASTEDEYDELRDDIDVNSVVAEPPWDDADYQAWRDAVARTGDDEAESTGPPEQPQAISPAAWPTLPDDALHGELGQFVRLAAPHTEADPAGILVASLPLLGGCIGGSPHVVAGNERHGAALFVVVIGATSKGRKGTAMAAGRALVGRVDPEFITGRLLGGFGSGEAMVDALRDPSDDDPGAGDKRICIDEPEYARLLKVAGRDGSTLGQIVRHAWDGRRLEARSRARTVVASNVHVSAVCQVTAEELRARLTDTETYGGTANRFLFAAVRRGSLHPRGGNIPEELLAHYGGRLALAVKAARRVGRVQRTPDAEREWERLYNRLAADEPGGLLGAVIGRDSAQCLRLSLLYALLDGKAAIDAEHVRAADALWAYSRASAAHVFGDHPGDSIADRLLAALRTSGPAGLDRTGQSAALGRHVPAARIDVAAARLIASGLAVSREEPTGGRPRRLLRACEESGSSEGSLTLRMTSRPR